MKTKASILYGIDDIVIKEIELPKLRKGEVLVRMHYAGLCGTQIGEIKGKRGEDKYLPHLLGHEGSGIVEDIGEGVTTVKLGDSVICSWIKGEGLEGGPKQYEDKYNVGSISTFQELSIISENRLTIIPHSMDMKIAALYGCMIPTGIGSLLNIFDIKEGSDIIVYGCGNIGSAAILGATLNKPKHLAVVEKNVDRLYYAKELGANMFYSSIDEIDVKFDYAIETTGNSDVMNYAVNSIKDSGRVVITGNIPPNEKLCIDPVDLNKGKIYGSWGGFRDRYNVHLKDFIYYTHNTLDLSKLTIHEYKLDNIKNAIDDFDSIPGKILIGMI